MSQNPLKAMLQRADLPGPSLLAYDEWVTWPERLREALEAAGILRQASHAHSVICDGCAEACIESVVFDDCSGLPTEAYVICTKYDDVGRVEVELDRLRQWTVDLDALADFLAG